MNARTRISSTRPLLSSSCWRPYVESLEDRLLLTADIANGLSVQTESLVKPTDGASEMRATLTSGVGATNVSTEGVVDSLQSQLLESNASNQQTPVVQYRVSITDSGGFPLQSVPVGNDFLIQVHVKHVHSNSPTVSGIFAAYTRLVMDGTGFEITGDITIGDGFPNARRVPANGDQQFDLIGGMIGAWRSGIDDALLFEIPARAIEPGDVVIRTGSVAAEPNLNATLLLGDNSAVPYKSIDFGSTLLSIDAPPRFNEPVQPNQPVVDPPPTADAPTPPPVRGPVVWGERPTGDEVQPTLTGDTPPTLVSYRPVVPELKSPEVPSGGLQDVLDEPEILLPRPSQRSEFDATPFSGDELSDQREPAESDAQSRARDQSPIEGLLQRLGDADKTLANSAIKLWPHSPAYQRSEVPRLALLSDEFWSDVGSHDVNQQAQRDLQVFPEFGGGSSRAGREWNAGVDAAHASLDVPSRPSQPRSSDASAGDLGAEGYAREDYGEGGYAEGWAQLGISAGYSRPKLRSLALWCSGLAPGHSGLWRYQPGTESFQAGRLMDWVPTEETSPPDVEPMLDRTTLAKSLEHPWDGFGLLGRLRFALRSTALTGAFQVGTMLAMSVAFFKRKRRTSEPHNSISSANTVNSTGCRTEVD